MSTSIRRTIAAAVAVCVVGLGPVPVHATLVTSEQAAAPQATPEREQLAGLFDRETVRVLLLAQGIDPGVARERVNAITDEEARRMAQDMDDMPAGGEVIAVLFTVFVVLLATDILGLTKVYPFTRPIR